MVGWPCLWQTWILVRLMMSWCWCCFHNWVDPKCACVFGRKKIRKWKKKSFLITEHVLGILLLYSSVHSLILFCGKRQRQQHPRRASMTTTKFLDFGAGACVLLRYDVVHIKWVLGFGNINSWSAYSWVKNSANIWQKKRKLVDKCTHHA